MADGAEPPVNRAAVVAVVQARLGSARFPRKVLAELDGRPLLRVLLTRLRAAETVDEIVVAVPEGADDDELAAAVSSWGHEVSRGPGDDVLARYLNAIEGRDAEVVVRVTGDCPLIDPRLVDAVVRRLLHGDAQYAALDERFPDGADCEAMRRSALLFAGERATKPSEREHVTLWIREHPDLVSVSLVTSELDRSRVRLTVDEPADLVVLQRLVERLGSDPSIGIDRYADLLMSETALEADRSAIARNEGLWRSKNLDLLSEIGLRRGRQRSDELLERAMAVIPSGSQTLSKAADQFVRGVTPSFLQSGLGCHVIDVDDNVFIDYPMALGPVLLGYGYPRTVEAVSSQVAKGTTFTLPHPLEVEVAELVVESVPCAEMVRFAKNGSDVTDAAVRLARACTGRDVVLVCGYHGWHDWYVVHTARSAGVPKVLAEYIDSFAFNDVAGLQDALDRHDGDVAAVILEVSFEDPDPGFLEQVQARTHRAGAVLIFDEIVTGFRFALGGAQELYGVVPDLACFGKAMANGLPLAAVAGRRDLMQEFDQVFFSGTFGGETIALAAARSVIEELMTAPVIDHIWEEGRRLHKGINAEIRTAGLDIELSGQPPRAALYFRRDGEIWPELRGLFLQETVRRGVLFGGPIHTTYAHERAHIERTIDIVGESLDVLRAAVESESVERQLDGPAPGVVFRLKQS